MSPCLPPPGPTEVAAHERAAAMLAQDEAHRTAKLRDALDNPLIVVTDRPGRELPLSTQRAEWIRFAYQREPVDVIETPGDHRAPMETWVQTGLPSGNPRVMEKRQIPGPVKILTPAELDARQRAEEYRLRKIHDEKMIRVLGAWVKDAPWWDA